MNSHRSWLGALVALGLVGVAAFAAGQSNADEALAAHDRGNNYRVTILVSNETDEAPVVDPLLVNAWGIAASDTGPWWVADNGSGYSTVYNGDGDKLPLEVKVPGAPTGTVHNGSTQFQMAAGTPATFPLRERGRDLLRMELDRRPECVCGLQRSGVQLQGPRHPRGRAVFDRLRRVQSRGLPRELLRRHVCGIRHRRRGSRIRASRQGFCPFGIRAVGDSIFVTYALKDGDDDVPGIGHGFVRQFDADGNLVARVGSHGLLNSPWGLAMAPADFGTFGGCLLVGNFGDGKINAFCQNHGGQWHFAGRLRHRHTHLDRRSLGHRLRQRRGRRPARRPVLCRRTRRRIERLLRQDRSRPLIRAGRPVPAHTPGPLPPPGRRGSTVSTKDD